MLRFIGVFVLIGFGSPAVVLAVDSKGTPAPQKKAIDEPITWKYVQEVVKKDKEIEKNKNLTEEQKRDMSLKLFKGILNKKVKWSGTVFSVQIKDCRRYLKLDMGKDKKAIFDVPDAKDAPKLQKGDKISFSGTIDLVYPDGDVLLYPCEVDR